MRRAYEAELIDAPLHDLGEFAHSLDQVAQVNRWLGGERSLRQHLAPWIRGVDVRALDVGTGNGATLRRLGNWAEGRSVTWRAVAVELNPQAAALARHGGTSVVIGDALRLPFADDTFDVTLCTLTLHHFADDDAVTLLGEMARVSRGTVLVSDLERSTLNYWGARLLAASVWRDNRLTRHDGPLSVRRSFTRSELLEIGRRAGLRDARVRRHVPWRIVLEGRP